MSDQSAEQIAPPDEVTVDLLISNASNSEIREYWIGHNTVDKETGAEMFYKEVTIARNQEKAVGRIRLKKSTKDYWLLYWRDGSNNLNGLTKQWFKAEAQRADGQIVMYLNEVGGELVIQQKGEALNEQKTEQFAPGID